MRSAQPPADAHVEVPVFETLSVEHVAALVRDADLRVRLEVVQTDDAAVLSELGLAELKLPRYHVGKRVVDVAQILLFVGEFMSCWLRLICEVKQKLKRQKLLRM